MLTPGTKVGHYKILGPIGAGGMGEVYRAHDDQLDRDVAIKVLPAQSFADNTARARLLREARAAAALNHPNICTVHEVGEADGQAYIAMELIEGRPLSEAIPRGGLPTDQVLRYGSQIAGALAHAHERGIIHRDLKSGNVVITADGRAKVLDLGLAKRLSHEELAEATTQSQASLTQPGAVLGTLPYMAPEQLRGQGADARSDVWALGVVLHEMSAGARPFQGQTGYELSSAILSQPPGPLPTKVPVELRAVIERCLAKESGQRYQRAGEVRAALETLVTGAAVPGLKWEYLAKRRWFRATAAVGAAVLVVSVLLGLNVGGLRDRLFGPATPKIKSLAVLPLDNLSGDPEQEYFADGMTEALITELGQIRALKVISRTSAMRYKGVEKPPVPQLARELRVDGVVEGSVQRVESRVQVAVRLVHARTDTQLWSKAFQKDRRDLLALQSEMAQEIAREVKIALTPAEATRLASRGHVDPEAHELYLKGRYYWNRYEYRKALESFRRAIDREPGYALAYVGLADTYYGLSGLYLPPDEAMPKARAAAAKALELDGTLAEAHASLGNIHMTYERDWPAAEKSFRHALDRYPNYATAHFWYGIYLTYQGRFREADHELEKAQELDPLSPTNAAITAWSTYNSRRYEQAIREAQEAIELEPDFFPSHLSLGLPYEQKGMFAEALAEYETAARLSDAAPVSELLRARVLVKMGRKDEARKILTVLEPAARKNPAGLAYHLAALYLTFGERTQALDWLDKAHKARSEEMLIMKVDPVFDDLRGDPRFQDLLRRMNFPKN